MLVEPLFLSAGFAVALAAIICALRPIQTNDSFAG